METLPLPLPRKVPRERTVIAPRSSLWVRRLPAAAVMTSPLVLCSWLAATAAAAAPNPDPADEVFWRSAGKRSFVNFLASLGCEDCLAFAEGSYSEAPIGLSSQIFGCADVDALLPSLHLLYEAARAQNNGQIPGLLVDGGANVGRVTSRWIAAFGDAFGRRVSANATHAHCIICAGADATAGNGAAGAASAPPTVFVVSIEPSPSNFVLLEQHAMENGWRDEGWLGVQAAMGEQSGEALLAMTEGFAIDEVATLLYKPEDDRPKKKVQVVSLDDAVEAGLQQLPPTTPRSVFLLKLDVEGMEPAVLRSLRTAKTEVKFVTFEFSSGVWQEPLQGVVADLYSIGFFCFIVTTERLLPVSPPFWDVLYNMPVWSNLFCGQENDPDLAALVQLHAGVTGLWPMLPGMYLEELADENAVDLTFTAARKACLDLGSKCAGITCDCAEERGRCSGRPASPFPKPERCSPRTGRSRGAKWSPSGEVSFMRDTEASELFLLYRRAVYQKDDVYR